LHRIVKHFGLDASRVAGDLIATLDKLPRGATSISDFSPHLEEAVERGWLYASLLYGDSRVRTGHLILGMLKTPGLKNVFGGISREFGKIKTEELSDSFNQVVGGSSEDALGAQESGGGVSPGEASGAIPPAQMGKQEAL